MKENCKIFHLQRDVDSTGISGTGIVAIGVQLPSGKCVMEWTSFHSSVTIFSNISDIELLHGHDGKTKVVWGLPKDCTENKPKRKGKTKGTS